MEQNFTSVQVSQLTRLSARQLQWWDEQGIVVPAREGHRRLYSLENVAEISVICELRRRGFSLQRIRKVIRYLQRELGRRLVETVSAGGDLHLLTDGRSIYLKDTDRGVVDVLKNARQPIIAVCLSDAVQQVRADLATISRMQAGGELQAERKAPRKAPVARDTHRPNPRRTRRSKAVGE